MPTPLTIGWAATDITPDCPVELAGQYYQRLSTGIRDRLHATALAIEGADESGAPAQAILMSVDLVSVKRELVEELRARLAPKMPGFDARHLVLNAIHTHNAPAPQVGRNWWKPDPSAITPEEYRPFLLEKLEQAALSAWQNRKPGTASWRVARASVGHCRRAMYADGSAEMYGDTSRPDFVGMEGNEDAGLDLLYFWDAEGQLTGVIVNLPCPAQVMEATYVVTADYVGELRKRLKARFGEHVHLLAQIAPAGDQSPRDLTRQGRRSTGVPPVNAVEEAKGTGSQNGGMGGTPMLRVGAGEPDYWNEAGMVEIGRRLDEAVAAEHEPARAATRDALPFRHLVRDIQLPVRRVSEAEVAEAKAVLDDLLSREPADPDSPQAAFNRFVAETRTNEKKGGPGPYDSKLHDFVLIRNNEAVLARQGMQDGQPSLPVELHALRIGDVAMVNNPFELYLDYGHRIRARSAAGQTFMVQLSGDGLGYLPTRRAVAAGGYGGLVINGRIGPEGGEMLVEETLRAIGELWHP